MLCLEDNRNTSVYVFITEIFLTKNWCNNWRSIIDIVEGLDFRDHCILSYVHEISDTLTLFHLGEDTLHPLMGCHVTTWAWSSVKVRDHISYFCQLSKNQSFLEKQEQSGLGTLDWRDLLHSSYSSWAHVPQFVPFPGK